jgi:hypothetical protein
MSTSSTDPASVKGRDSYATDTSVGVWAGIIFGVFTIIPTMILGILTIPFTFPVVIWKTID